MLRGSTDDGPKLREEKQFDEFYTDLEKDTLIPILSPRDADAAGNDDLALPETHINNQNHERFERPAHTKQLMFNGIISLEPIKLNHSRQTFKRCEVAIAQLDNIQKERSQRGGKFKKSRNASSHTIFDEDHEPYITKFSTVARNSNEALIDLKSLDQISKNLRNFNIEYDMDEQDELYLHYLNSEYCNNKLTYEAFELMLSVLETEWNHLEKQIPPRAMSANASMSDHQSKTGRLHYELYGSDDGTGSSSDQTCAVCGGGDSDNSNAIVFCDGCDVAVHQECYGIVFIPEGQWLCRRCLVSKNRKVNCLFCPSHTGAFKQTDTGSWAHVACGLWIPELYFANVHYMEPIEGVENISRSRWKLVCSICKQKMGACIQCAHKNCFTAFHVTCAKRAGLYMDYGGASIGEMASNQAHSSHSPRCFCDKHAPHHWPNSAEGILKTRRYFLENKENGSAGSLAQRSINSSAGLTQRKNKWKTNRGTPIAPHCFAEIVQRVLKLLRIPNFQEVSYNVCKYWSMKRELKRGAPLVRKFDPSSYNLLDENQLQERLEFTDDLLKDLSNLQDLAELVSKRAITSKLLGLADLKSEQLSKFPNEYLIKHAVIEKLISSEPFKNLESLLPERGLQRQLSRWKSCSLAQVPEFKEGIVQFLGSLELLPSANRALLSNARKAHTLLNELYRNVENIDADSLLHQDFIFSEDGSHQIQPRLWKGPYLKQKEGLSDVEELSAQEERKLNQLLTINPSSR